MGALLLAVAKSIYYVAQRQWCQIWWGQGFHGFIGFVVSMVSWFHSRVSWCRWFHFFMFLVSQVSWCQCFHDFIGFVASRVSWFHRFRGVNDFVVSQVSWCERSRGFMGFMVSEVSWFHRPLGVKQPPRRRPLGFVRHAFISPPRTSAKHSRHLRSLISEAFDRVCEKFVMNAELNKYQRDAILQILQRRPMSS